MYFCDKTFTTFVNLDISWQCKQTKTPTENFFRGSDYPRYVGNPFHSGDPRHVLKVYKIIYLKKGHNKSSTQQVRNRLYPSGRETSVHLDRQQDAFYVETLEEEIEKSEYKTVFCDQVHPAVRPGGTV